MASASFDIFATCDERVSEAGLPEFFPGAKQSSSLVIEVPLMIDSLSADHPGR